MNISFFLCISPVLRCTEFISLLLPPIAHRARLIFRQSAALASDSKAKWIMNHWANNIIIKQFLSLGARLPEKPASRRENGADITSGCTSCWGEHSSILLLRNRKHWKQFRWNVAPNEGDRREINWFSSSALAPLPWLLQMSIHKCDRSRSKGDWNQLQIFSIKLNKSPAMVEFNHLSIPSQSGAKCNLCAGLMNYAYV